MVYQFGLSLAQILQLPEFRLSPEAEDMIAVEIIPMMLEANPRTRITVKESIRLLKKAYDLT